MGQTCGCADKGDQEQEVRADPVSISLFQWSLNRMRQAKSAVWHQETLNVDVLTLLFFLFRKGLEVTMDIIETVELKVERQLKVFPVLCNSTLQTILYLPTLRQQPSLRVSSSLMSLFLKMELSIKVRLISQNLNHRYRQSYSSCLTISAFYLGLKLPQR